MAQRHSNLLAALQLRIMLRESHGDPVAPVGNLESFDHH
jgi:hypothetical protein